MAEVLAIAAHTGAVFRRQFLVWRQIFWSSVSTNVANPILLLFAFGFGLGSVIDVMGGVDYLAFIVPGMMAYSAMFAASAVRSSDSTGDSCTICWKVVRTLRCNASISSASVSRTMSTASVTSARR